MSEVPQYGLRLGCVLVRDQPPQTSVAERPLDRARESGTQDQDALSGAARDTVGSSLSKVSFTTFLSLLVSSSHFINQITCVLPRPLGCGG